MDQEDLYKCLFFCFYKAATGWSFANNNSFNHHVTLVRGSHLLLRCIYLHSVGYQMPSRKSDKAVMAVRMQNCVETFTGVKDPGVIRQ